MNTNKCFIKGGWAEDLPLGSTAGATVVGDLLELVDGELVPPTSTGDMSMSRVKSYYIAGDYAEAVATAMAGEGKSTLIGKLTVYPITSEMRIEGFEDHAAQTVTAGDPLTITDGKVTKTMAAGQYVFGFATKTTTANDELWNITTEGVGYEHKG